MGSAKKGALVREDAQALDRMLLLIVGWTHRQWSVRELLGLMEWVIGLRPRCTEKKHIRIVEKQGQGVDHPPTLIHDNA